MSPYGTLLPSAEAASCPQLAEGDIGALADRSGFDPQETSADRLIGTAANKKYRLVCRQPKPNQVILILYGARPALQGGCSRKRRGHYG